MQPIAVPKTPGQSAATGVGRKRRVLLIAEACNPQWSSVPLIGYCLSKALALRDDLELTLVTQVRNRAAIEVDPITQLVPVHYIDNEAASRPFVRVNNWLRGSSGVSWTINTAFSWPCYMTFERMVYEQFSERFRGGEFDLIHRLTPVSPTMGSPLASLSDVPMVIGPLNGGLPWPKEFPELRRLEREWLVPFRRLYKWLPYHRSTYRRLAGVIAGSRHTASEIPASFRGRRYYLPENAVDPARFSIAEEWPAPQGRFRFVTVGRLVPYKGMDLILHAMKDSEVLRGCELLVIGDGPQRPLLEGLVRDFGLEPNVTFLGWAEHREVAAHLGRSQAFVFPSLREFGGGVVVEAMAKALPSVVVDYGGPGELINADCGISIPMGASSHADQGCAPGDGVAGDRPRSLPTAGRGREPLRPGRVHLGREGGADRRDLPGIAGGVAAQTAGTVATRRLKSVGGWPCNRS